MTYSRDTTALSELTGEPVGTWSEEWRIETEARTLLKMSREQRGAFFNGRKDENGQSIDGACGIRGPATAEKSMETVRQLQTAREDRP